MNKPRLSPLAAFYCTYTGSRQIGFEVQLQAFLMLDGPASSTPLSNPISISICDGPTKTPMAQCTARQLKVMLQSQQCKQYRQHKDGTNREKIKKTLSKSK